MSNAHYDRLRLRHMRLLQLIEEKGSLRAVAEQLNLSQPAVSVMLRDLEDAFKAVLVHRSARGVSLNELGHLALMRSRLSLAFIDQLAKEIESHDRPVLRVGANPAVMQNPISQALKILLKKDIYPRFTFQTGLVKEMVDALIVGKIDCYIGRVDWERIPAASASLLQCVEMGASPICVACRLDHPLAQATQVRPTDLLQYPWAAGSTESSNWIELDTQFRVHGLAPPQVEISVGMFGMLAIAAETDCLICVPERVIKHQATGRALKILQVKDFNLTQARIDFVTLVTPQKGSPEKDMLSALQTAVGNGS